MTPYNARLLDILLNVLQEMQAREMVYTWEWEVSLVPECFLTINDQDICDRIPFAFTELDLDQLVKAGYFEKMVELNTETEVIIHYHLK